MQFAPKAYRDTRIATTQQVESALAETANLTNITSALLRQHPEVLPILRMAAAPPIARDRLIGLAGVSPNLVKNMEEKQRIPPRADIATLDAELTKISQIIARLLDKDIFPWLESGQQPTETEVQRGATIVADRFAVLFTAFELVKLMEADCDRINRLVPIPENHPLYSNQCHHRGTAIIVQARRWIARGCGKKDDTQYTGLLSFLGGCPPVFCCGGALSKLGNIVRTWLSHFSYRAGGIVGCI